MKTAMQELIDEIKEAVPYFKLDIYQPNFNKALEKEKLQIEEAFRKGGDFRSFGGNPDYYNETYKNETP